MKLKYLLWLGIAIFMFMLGQTAADMWAEYTDKTRLYRELLGQKDAYEQLSENLAKLEVQYKEEKELHERAKKEWAEVSKAKDERIKLLSDATYLISRHVEKQDGPDYSFRTKNGTKNYVLNELRISGQDSPPIGYILIKNDGRTYKRNYKFEIQVKNLQTIDEKTGRVKFYAKAFLVQKEVSPLKKRIKNYTDFTDVPYPLEITGGTVLYDPTVKNQLKNRYMWAPSLMGGVNFGNFDQSPAKAALGVSLFGYGQHPEALQYKLLQIGVGLRSDGSDFDIHLVPISMRPLPKILKNTYIGPGIGKEGNSTVFFLNTSVGF